MRLLAITLAEVTQLVFFRDKLPVCKVLTVILGIIACLVNLPANLKLIPVKASIFVKLEKLEFLIIRLVIFVKLLPKISVIILIVLAKIVLSKLGLLIAVNSIIIFLFISLLKTEISNLICLIIELFKSNN